MAQYLGYDLSAFPIVNTPSLMDVSLIEEAGVVSKLWGVYWSPHPVQFKIQLPNRELTWVDTKTWTFGLLGDVANPILWTPNVP